MGRVQLARQQQGRSRPLPVDQCKPQLVASLKDDFRSFLRMDLADSTVSSYDSQENQYRMLCRMLGQLEKPSADVLARFVVGRALNGGHKRSTIEVGVAPVSRWAADEGLFGDGQEGLATHPLVRRALRIAAKHAVPPGQKKPLGRDDLQVLVKYLVGRRDFIGDRDAAMFLVGWAGMFRSAEIAAIEWRNLHMYAGKGEEEKGVAIYVPYSKTDQSGEGAWVFVAACEDKKTPYMCPLRALQRLKQWGSGKGSVFTSKAGGDGISKGTLGPRLKKGLSEAGVADAGAYAAHSLRRGGATYAAQQQVEVRKIMIMGSPM
jgi:hypothetical protein